MSLAYELDFWDDCLDTFEEERKQRVYAGLMGITFDLEGRSVIDIGSGPVSMLLKCRNRGQCFAIDPLMGEFPGWVRSRYREAQIAPLALLGEDVGDLTGQGLDEAWIYNVLTHTERPEKIIAAARQVAGLVRIFEWIDMPARDGHPTMLTQDDLEEWLGGRGMTVQLAQDGCFGRAFYGVFG